MNEIILVAVAAHVVCHNGKTIDAFPNRGATVSGNAPWLSVVPIWPR
jgi:hypothetical protein